MELINSEATYSLKDLLAHVECAVKRAAPAPVWVFAEIASINRSGHVYIDLVQKENLQIVAKTRANLWRSDAARILPEFTAATGMELSAGMNVLMNVSLTFSAQYGFSLTVRGIDATYTLGEMEKQRRATLDRLRREGLMDLNRDLIFPMVPQRIAVISSATAAGYEDFVSHLRFNGRCLRFHVQLFPASMQGNNAEESLVTSIREARRLHDKFDVLVVIRGGGAKTDLHCFDSYLVAKELAQFPLPVITGIGHERDESVADAVAHTRAKTPTAVGDLLIHAMCEFEDAICSLHERIVRSATLRLTAGNQKVDGISQRIGQAALHKIAAFRVAVSTCGTLAASRANLRLEREAGRIATLTETTRLLDPINTLRRGYSLVYFGGKALRNASDVEPGAAVQVQLASGSLNVNVTERHLEPESPNAPAAALAS